MSDRDVYVVIMPFSLTNPTGKFLVTTVGAWSDAIDSGMHHVARDEADAATATAYDTYDVAHARSVELNAYRALTRAQPTLSKEVTS